MAKRKKRRKKHQTKKTTTSSQQEKTFSVYLHDAVQALQKNDIRTATTFATHVVRQSRNRSETKAAREILAEASFRTACYSTNIQEKQKNLQSALEHSPQDPRFHFHQGITFLQAEKSVEALKEFDLVAEAEPEREGLSYFRQLARLAQGQNWDAEANLTPGELNSLKMLDAFTKKGSKRSITTLLKDGLPENHAQLWTALLKMQQEKHCAPVDELQQAAHDSVQSRTAPIMAYYAGVAAMRADQQDVAKTHWNAALSAHFSPAWIHKNLGVTWRGAFRELLKAEQWQQIVEASRQLPEQLDDSTLNEIISLAHYHLGYAAAQQEDWQQAVSHWNKAAETSPNRYLAQNLALAEEHLEHWPNAAEAWSDMLRRRPRRKNHPDYLSKKQVALIWEHVADCYQQAELHNDVIDSLKKAIKAAPDNIAFRLRLADTLMAEHRSDDAAVRELHNILEIAPENIEALTRMAHYYKDDWRHESIPLWKKIIQLDPENAQAKEELVNAYVNQVLPKQDKGPFGFFNQVFLPYSRKVAVLQEALELLPNHPRLLVTLGVVQCESRKYKQARDSFLRAYQAAPQNVETVGTLLHELLHAKGGKLVDELIPAIHELPNLTAHFWVDQGGMALRCQLGDKWAKRFFDEALAHLQYSQRDTKAGVLIDIYITVAEDHHAAFQDHYEDIIRREMPANGVIEMVEAIDCCFEEQNINKAKRKLKKARKLASKAGDPRLLEQISMIEQLFTLVNQNMLNMLAGMTEEDLLNMLGMVDEMEENDEFF